MLGLIFRFFFTVLIIAGVLFLIAGSLLVAIVITPVVFLLIYFFGRKTGIRMWSVRTGQAPLGGWPRQGPVIDHDPSDLPSDTPPGDR
jgi:hypothetical protein